MSSLDVLEVDPIYPRSEPAEANIHIQYTYIIRQIVKGEIKFTKMQSQIILVIVMELHLLHDRQLGR